ERVVLPPPGEIQYRATMQFVRGDLVRDPFLGRGHSLADGAPHAFEYVLHGLGLRGDVLVDGLELGLGHGRFQSSGTRSCALSELSSKGLSIILQESSCPIWISVNLLR